MRGRQVRVLPDKEQQSSSLQELYLLLQLLLRCFFTYRKAISFFTEHDQMCVTNNIYPAVTIFVLVVLALM